MKLGAPVVMTALQSLAADAPATIFDIARLSAPHREPLMVTELRFATKLVDGVAGWGQGYVNLGYELRASITVGQYLLADDVPVWSLAPVVDNFMEGIDSGLMCCFRWRLTRPMYLPPGMGFRIAIRRELVRGVLAAYSTSPVPVWASVVGQTVEGDLPRTMVVPYAASFDPAPVAAPSTQQFNAGQQDLINATGSDIELKYGIGRLALIYPIAGAVAPGIFAECWDVLDAGVKVSAPCTMQIGDDVIVPQGTEFNSAFDYARRMLRLSGATLKSGSRATFSMKYPAGTPAEWSNPGSYYWAPNVTLVGARKENVP